MTERGPAEPTFGAGHNSQPMSAEWLAADLDEALKAKATRQKELIEAAKTWESCDDDSDNENIAELIKMINTLGEEIEAIRVARKGPYDALAAVVQAACKATLLDPLGVSKEALKKLQTPYVAAKKKREDEAARVKAAEAAAKLAVATTPVEAKAAAKELKQANTALAKGGGRSKSDMGVATGATSRWVFEVTDIKLVPPAYLMINDVVVNSVISGKNGAREIPGLRIYEKQSVTNV